MNFIDSAVKYSILSCTTIPYYLCSCKTVITQGQRVTRSGTGCESCPIEAFQPEENDSQVCKVCTKCESGKCSE